MVILCPKCQSINPDDSLSCYKCGMLHAPKAVPYSISRVAIKPSTIGEYTAIVVGIGVIIYSIWRLIGTLQYSNQGVPNDMGIIFAIILIITSIEIVVSYLRIRKKTRSMSDKRPL